MQSILDFLSSFGWEIGGILLVALMLWRVITRDDRERRKYERTLAKQREYEADKEALEEHLGWDGLPSSRS